MQRYYFLIYDLAKTFCTDALRQMHYNISIMSIFSMRPMDYGLFLTYSWAAAAQQPLRFLITGSRFSPAAIVRCTD